MHFLEFQALVRKGRDARTDRFGVEAAFRSAFLTQWLRISMRQEEATGLHALDEAFRVLTAHLFAEIMGDL
jgi:phage terminase Nu1 subunit (DNA packaging protein)